VIHIARVEALRRIDEHDGTLRIGACATHRDIGESELIRARAPAVARCWRQLANPRVRCKGTVGGNVMARQSGYDATLMLMAADAKASVVASEGHCVDSSIAEAAMLQGLLTSIHVPEPDALQLRVDRSLYPALVVVVGFRQSKDVVTRLHAAVGGAQGQAYSAPLDVQEPVTRADLAAKAQVLARAFVSRLPAPGDDWRASGGYRTRMAAVLLQRLLAQEGRASC
jgi:carbon-monoxide dehydrogenase medium subunit